MIGIGEIVLLPLDVLKIKRQTNPDAFRGRGLFKIIADEGMGLYRGAGMLSPDLLSLDHR